LRQQELPIVDRRKTASIRKIVFIVSSFFDFAETQWLKLQNGRFVSINKNISAIRNILAL
jgi:hypothetical protein